MLIWQKKKTKLAGQFKRPKGMGPTGEVASHCIEREARKRVNKENKEWSSGIRQADHCKDGLTRSNFKAAIPIIIK